MQSGSSKFTPAEREVGTADGAKRRKMPANWFLMPRQRKYPSHDSHGNLSKNLLTHAESRAAANGHDDIARSAHDLLTKRFASSNDDNSSSHTSSNPGNNGNPGRRGGGVAGARIGGEANLGPVEAEANVGGRIGNGQSRNPVTAVAAKPDESKTPQRKQAQRHWL